VRTRVAVLRWEIDQAFIEFTNSFALRSELLRDIRKSPIDRSILSSRIDYFHFSRNSRLSAAAVKKLILLLNGKVTKKQQRSL
jgi:hypothetical protein